jgi:hypothetical protein
MRERGGEESGERFRWRMWERSSGGRGVSCTSCIWDIQSVTLALSIDWRIEFLPQYKSDCTERTIQLYKLLCEQSSNQQPRMTTNKVQTITSRFPKVGRKAEEPPVTIVLFRSQLLDWTTYRVVSTAP